jgi:hypothetical protein
LRTARCNSDYGQPHDYLRESYGEIIKNSDDFTGAGVLPPRGSAEVGLYFCTPTHHAAQSRTHLFDRMVLGLPQQLRVVFSASFHFSNKLTRDLARADFLQH